MTHTTISLGLSFIIYNTDDRRGAVEQGRMNDDYILNYGILSLTVG